MTSIRSTARRRRLAMATRERVAPLSQTAEYALRAMAYLAVPREESVRAADLADAIAVPAHYLSKVLRRLVQAGLLESQRGHGGGFVLSRPADQVRFVDVLAAVDALPTENRCAFGWGDCDVKNPCPLHPAWSRLNDAMTGWAEGTTLADVAGVRRKRR